MATKKKAAKANKSKRVLAVPLKEAADMAIQPKPDEPTHALKPICRAMRDEEKQAQTLQKIEALNIPKRLRLEVARVRRYMGGAFTIRLRLRRWKPLPWR